MKILLLSQFFSTTRGGGEYVFQFMANNLVENGHNVFVITNKIVNENYEEHKNIKLFFVSPTLEYKGGIPAGALDNLRYIINAIKTGIKIIRKEKIDLIHSNNFSPALAGSILSTLTLKPHVTTIHDIFSLCGKNYWKMWGNQVKISKINVILASRFEKLMIKLKFDCIHTVSETTKDDLIKFNVKKPIYVIPNCIYTGLKDTRISVNSFQFIYVGRLVFYKNVEVLIKAINIARKTEPNIKLLIVGVGPHKQILEELTNRLGLEQNVEFKGFVTADEKTRLLATSNALVFPSLCEGFGLVILEAFNQSRPVLVSNIRPMSDIVTHENNGFVLDPYDENQWSDYLLRIMKNPREASIMGRNGNMLLTTSYNREVMYQKILKMYSDMIENNR